MHGHRTARLCALWPGLAEELLLPTGKLKDCLIIDDNWSLATSTDRATHLNGVFLFATTRSGINRLVALEQKMDASGMIID